MKPIIFIDRRYTQQRRNNDERRLNPRLDLTFKRRRTLKDRRRQNASRLEDFFARQELARDQNNANILLH